MNHINIDAEFIAKISQEKERTKKIIYINKETKEHLTLIQYNELFKSTLTNVIRNKQLFNMFLQLHYDSTSLLLITKFRLKSSLDDIQSKWINFAIDKVTAELNRKYYCYFSYKREDTEILTKLN